MITRPCAGDIDAISRNETFITAQVDRGYRVLMPVAASQCGSGNHAKSTAQQAVGSADLPRCDQLANAAAGDRLAAQGHDRIYLDLESQCMAELRQAGDVSLASMAEPTVFAFINRFCAEPSH